MLAPYPPGTAMSDDLAIDPKRIPKAFLELRNHRLYEVMEEQSDPEVLMVRNLETGYPLPLDLAGVAEARLILPDVVVPDCLPEPDAGWLTARHAP